MDEDEPIARAKRSLTIAIAAIGALSLGAMLLTDYLVDDERCAPDPNDPTKKVCTSRSGRSGSGGRSWWGGHSSSSASSRGFSFGGFGGGHSGGS